MSQPGQQTYKGMMAMPLVFNAYFCFVFYFLFYWLEVIDWSNSHGMTFYFLFRIYIVI